MWECEWKSSFFLRLLLDKYTISISSNDDHYSNVLLSVNLIWRFFVGKDFALKSSSDSDSPPLAFAAPQKILVPGSQTDGSSPSSDQLELANTVSENHQVCKNYWLEKI